MNWTECNDVEIIPGKVSGSPLLVQSRVPADTVLSSAEAGESAEEIAYSFQLPVDQVSRVLAFAQSRSLIHSAA